MADQEQYTDRYVLTWLRQLSILHRAHWDAARFYEQVNLMLGIAAALTAAISGTTAFSRLAELGSEEEVSIAVQVFIGIFGLLAATFAALQTFFRASELAARHKQAAVKFGKLRRELQQYLHIGLPTDPAKCEALLASFREEWNAVENESLPIPDRIYKKALAREEKLATARY